MSRSQRVKGASGERDLCAILNDQLGTCVSRKLGQARDAGNDIDVGKFRIEVKRRNRIAMLRWLDQCLVGSGVDQIPLVAMREDGGEWAVLLRLKDFLPMMRGEL